ncbi:MAG: hypothetical protein IKL73_07980 [Lachnospiraceae bacterium]|nr:hypothetical protein [Lachnospira sp.]MBQ8731072.1 hypothetical protein [Lachnospiraceae bacterium]MBR6698179.1 hypothetical protein [Lachnospiraceae bacterium]
MKKRLQNYINYIKNVSKDNVDKAFLEEMLVQIGFFQHERLIHLIVTVLFAFIFMFVCVLLYLMPSMLTMLLTLIVTVVMGFYIKHYFLLENGVQKLYEEYDRLKEMEM